MIAKSVNNFSQSGNKASITFAIDKRLRPTPPASPDPRRRRFGTDTPVQVSWNVDVSGGARQSPAGAAGRAVI